MATPSSKPKKTVILALSGPSSSGKTTIARLLHRQIFPPGTTTLLHLDDFYRPESELPTRNGLLDWDSAGALDLVALERTLAYVKDKGKLPADFDSKEDTNAVGEINIPDSVVQDLTEQVKAWFDHKNARLVIVDGFLLLGQSIPQIRQLFDIRLLLRARFQDAKRRREARQGYATIEGWWQDPPGYVEKVVWPGYVEEHGYLFVNGNVDGDVERGIAGEVGVQVAPWGSMEDGLRWVLGRTREGVEGGHG